MPVDHKGLRRAGDAQVDCSAPSCIIADHDIGVTQLLKPFLEFAGLILPGQTVNGNALGLRQFKQHRMLNTASDAP